MKIYTTYKVKIKGYNHITIRMQDSRKETE